MWGLLTRSLLRSTVVRGIVRGVGAAALAGLGWKLGADAYDVIKRRIARQPRAAKPPGSR